MSCNGFNVLPMYSVGCTTGLQVLQEISGYDSMVSCYHGSLSGCLWGAATLIPLADRAGELAGGAARATDLLGTTARGVWDLGPAARGLKLEQELGGNLPPSFPTVDIWDGSAATSIKSIDLASKTYQDAGRLGATLNKYVDKVASFQGTTFSGVKISASDIQVRALTVAIPTGASASQLQAMYNAYEYGQGLGVVVNYVEFAG